MPAIVNHLQRSEAVIVHLAVGKGLLNVTITDNQQPVVDKLGGLRVVKRVGRKVQQAGTVGLSHAVWRVLPGSGNRVWEGVHELSPESV